MRRTLLLAGFLLSAAVLLGALGWISHLAVSLEAREREARQRAAFEERVRLALWRMDAAVAGLLAQENARPVELAPPGAPGTTPLTLDTAGEAAVNGPRAPTAEVPSPYLAARFEIGPTGEVREWAAARHATGSGASLLKRDVLLAALQQGPLAGRPRPMPGRQVPSRASRPSRGATAAAPARSTPRAGAAATGRAVPQKSAPAPGAAATTAEQASQLRPAAPRSPPAAPAGDDALPAAAGAERRPERAEDPVAREMANQSRLNRVEFEKRGVQNQAFGAQPERPPAGAAESPSAEAGPAATDTPRVAPAAPAPHGAGSPAAAPLAAAPKATPAAAPSSTPPPTTPTVPPPEPPRRASLRDRLSRPSPAPTPAAPGRALGAISAAWVGDDLILARRVARGGDEHLQGVRLDGPGTREWLAAQVRDLLPRAALFPLLPGESADLGRRLALLPLRLDAGPLPDATAAAGSPVSLGLAVASVAVLLSIAAAGLQLAASLRLARRRADFVSAVTHELRTPLTTFRLYTEMLAGDMLPAADRPAYLGTLRDEADRLGHLVDNVLAFARVERGHAEANLEVVELAPMVADVAGRLARRVERDGLTLVTEVSPEAAAARVRVDRVAVERILQNLADNACKYGRNAADPRLHLTVQLSERRALLTLRDHGRGLDRAGRRRLFRPFHRSAAQATGDAPGVGLGLALSRRLARGFGGDLRAVDPGAPAAGAAIPDTSADPGAAFELSLPLAT